MLAHTVYLFTPYMSAPEFNVTYLNTENYMIHIPFFSISRLKKNGPTDPPNFQAKKGQTNKQMNFVFGPY